jgi:hypothetical protein
LLSLAAILGAQGGSAGAQEVVTSPGVPSGETVTPHNGGVIYTDSAEIYDTSMTPTGVPLYDALANSYGYLRRDFGDGVGYHEGATALGFFAPEELNQNQGLFAQGQVLVTDDGNPGINLGGGYRYFVGSANRVIGVNAFFDAVESERENDRTQIGLGFETYGSMWDVVSNVYIPLDSERDTIRPVGGGLTKYEEAMGGIEAEFGVPIFDPSAFGRLRAYFGGYAYASNDRFRDDPAGMRVRLQSHFNEHATLQACFMTDDRNGDMATVSVELRGWNRRLPSLNNRSIDNRAKLYLPVVRQYRIANETYLH